MIQIQCQMRLLRRGKRISMETNASCRGEFSLGVVASQSSRVVTDAGDLFGSGRLDVVQLKRASHRGDEDVAIFTGGSAEVKMAETEDAATAHVAKAGGLAVEVLHVGTKLDHAKGNSGTDKGVAP